MAARSAPGNSSASPPWHQRSNALPPAVLEQRVTCSVEAAIRYDIPANLLLAVAEVENGRPGQRVRNTNGTFDVGVMQFNTAYLKGLQPFGITASHVAASPCYPFELAAWRLAGHLAMDRGDEQESDDEEQNNQRGSHILMTKFPLDPR